MQLCIGVWLGPFHFVGYFFSNSVLALISHTWRLLYAKKFTQEVDRFQDLEEALKVRGFSGIWKVGLEFAVF